MEWLTIIKEIAKDEHREVWIALIIFSSLVAPKVLVLARLWIERRSAIERRIDDEQSKLFGHLHEEIDRLKIARDSAEDRARQLRDQLQNQQSLIESLSEQVSALQKQIANQ